MPSGVEAFEQMGLGSLLARVSAQDQHSLAVYLNGQLMFREELEAESMGGHPLKAVCQSELLEMMVREAAKAPCFTLEKGASVKDLIFDGERVVGVRARTAEGEKEIRADLVVGADGRASIVRKRGKFRVREVSPPLDVVWCKMACPEDWGGPRAYTGSGHFLIAYRTWDQQLQIGWLIRKGTFGEFKGKGVEVWLAEMQRHVSPDFRSHIQEFAGEMGKPFFLDAKSECLDHWSVPGALAIGDAAHTMSPVGGQGLNVALRDAVVAANHLVPVLSSSRLDDLPAALMAIESERMPEISYVQRFQGMAPRVGFTSAWWADPLRKLVLGLASYRPLRLRAAGRLQPIVSGVTEVVLKV